MRRHRTRGQPSPELVARMAAVLGAIPPAFQPAPGPPEPGLDGASPQAQPNVRRRRSLSNATHAAWQRDLGAAEQQLVQLGVGRTRSEPAGPQQAAASPLASPALLRQGGSSQQPLPASPAPQASKQPQLPAASPGHQAAHRPSSGSPGPGRRLLRSMRHRARPAVAAARPPRPPAVTPPSASRQQSGAGGLESSPRNTPFVLAPAAASPPVSPSPRPEASPPLATSPGRPSPKAAAPPVARPASQQLATLQPPGAAQLAEAPASLARAAAGEAAANAAPPLPRLLSSLPRRLQADLLALLRRQRDYVGARRRERERALRRLQKQLGRLEDEWHNMLQGSGAAGGRGHALRALQRQGSGAAPHRSSSEPGAGPAVLGGAAVPPLALEWSEPTLGGECLLDATLRPPSPASQRAHSQQPAERRPGTPLPHAAGAEEAGGAPSRAPSLQGGQWSPPPATPRLPLFGEAAGAWARLAGQRLSPGSPAAHGVPPAGGGLETSTPPAGCAQQERSPASSPATSPPGGGRAVRPQTALERLKQSHLYSLLPSRRFSFTSGTKGVEPAAGQPRAHAVVQLVGVAQPKERARAARPPTTPAGPGQLAAPLELRGQAIKGGAAVSPAAAGGGAGALDALKRRRRATAAGQLEAVAASRPTTAPG